MRLTNFIRVVAFAAGAATATIAQAADISGAGATFPFPIYAKWADSYKKDTGNGLNYQSIGSGAGIKQIKARTVTFGATDAPLEPKELDKAGLAQFPMVMGGIVAVVNLPGVKPGDIVIDGPTLAQIYLGKITNWNDAALKTLNPKLDLPNLPIVPDPSRRRVRHHLQLHLLSRRGFAGLEVGGRGGDDGGLARRHRRQRQ